MNLRFAYTLIDQNGEVFVWLAYYFGHILTVLCSLLFFGIFRCLAGLRSESSFPAPSTVSGHRSRSSSSFPLLGLIAPGLRLLAASFLLVVLHFLLVVPMHKDSLTEFYVCATLLVIPLTVVWGFLNCQKWWVSFFGPPQDEGSSAMKADQDAQAPLPRDRLPSYTTLSEETGPSSSWISERRGRGSEPTEWMSIELQESQQPELRPEVGVSEAEVRSLPSSTRDPITAPEKRRKGAWMKLVQRGWRIFDYLAGIRDHHSQNTRWGRRLGLGVVLLYFTLILFHHVILIETRLYYNRLNDVPKPRCSCLGEECTSEEEVQKLFARYQKLHHTILHETPPEKQRFVFFTAPESGLGNRMQALTSAFLVALLTDRALIVQWKSHMMSGANIDDLFQHPGFDWSSPEAYNIMATSSVPDWKSYISFPYCRTCASRGGKHIRDSYSRLLCDADASIETDARVLQIYSTQWFAPVLAHNPHYRDRICKLLGKDLGGVLTRFLYKPVPAIQNEIDRLKAEFDQSHRVIGLKLRMNEASAIDLDQVDSFYTCAAALEEQLYNLPPRVAHPVGAGPPKKVRWFLATDRYSEKVRLQSLIGDRLIDAGAGMVSKSGAAGMMNAVVDMWVLGEADELINSPYSTFGYMAHTRTSLLPHVVAKSSHCYRLHNSQPCFQYWFAMPLLSCWENSMFSVDMMNQHNCMM